MASKKFMNALNALCEEKGIEQDVFLDMLKESIEKSYKKIYLSPEANVRVDLNPKTGQFRLFEIRTVVDNLDDEDIEMSLDEAHEIDSSYKVGDIIETEIDVEIISRLAANQAKQLFRQKIRETEKEALYEEFHDKKDEILTGTVERVEPRFAIIQIGKIGAFLSKANQIPNEELVEGTKTKVYVAEVDRDTKGTHLIVSRTDPNFVKRLFELEVPEVFDGLVEIKAVSREPGDRTKIAVYSRDENIDPVGSCVGPKGSRVKNVVDELSGEMIDIIEWSEDPVTFITNALAPSDVTSVIFDDEKHSATVIVPDNQLSLAIGKRGQNARLAVHLTGWKIDIKSLSEANEMNLFAQKQKEQPQASFEDFKELMMNAVETKKVEPVVEPKPAKVVEEHEDTVASHEAAEKAKAVRKPPEKRKQLNEEQSEILKKLADFQDEIGAGTEDKQAVVVTEEEEKEDGYEYDSKYDEDIDYDAYDEYYD
ncbi:MAG: transcription termination factor NusA [Erysipelotrichaceae bacterium]|nr:transcription termination factor NusA [Erysipelotrichaceae bacterium]